ncbi:MAG: XrtA/PEP-CTERM system-associated ATPase [Methylococcales bacterium]
MYETFYKLRKKPFQLNPDPEFFFNSPVHKRALAYLRYGLAQGEGFIVVTGQPGTGKTMLVKALFQEIRHENVVAGLMVTTHVGADDTLRIIAATYGLSHDGTKAALLQGLENFFRTKAREGKRILLVVDEAQNLPKESLEELRMLSNFEMNGRSLFQSFLLGQDEFRQLLQIETMEQVRQRVTATYHLRPFEENETKDYIYHRLTTAGWKNDPQITDEAYAEIHRFASGIPRRINSLCDRLLLYGFLEELHGIDRDAVKTVIDEIKEDAPNQAGVDFVDGNLSLINPAILTPVDGTGSLEERILRLEKLVENLRQVVQKERVLLRKAVLIHLDLNDAYDQDVAEADLDVDRK